VSPREFEPEVILPNYVHPPQSEEEIASIFMEIADAADRLKAAGVARDIELVSEQLAIVRRGWRRDKVLVRTIPGWIVPHYPGKEDLDRFALGIDGQLYLYHYFDGEGDIADPPLLENTTLLSEHHLQTVITVEEVRERLQQMLERAA